MRALVVALVALGFVTLAPLAAADHVFSHRVHLAGRVIDADGRPAAGLRVAAELSWSPSIACAIDGTPDETDATGDFVLCRHAHTIPSNATVTLRVGDVVATKRVDEVLRHAWFHLQLPASRTARDIEGDRSFDANVVVAGRAYEKLLAPLDVEGVKVNGTPRVAENVTARLVAGGVTLSEATGATDATGDFKLRLAAGAMPPDARVVVRLGEDEADQAVAPAWRRADLYLVHEEDLAFGQQPGATTPLPFALAATALVVAAWATRGRGKR